MAHFRELQSARHEKRLRLFQVLASADSKSMRSVTAESILSEFSNINDEELSAIQECYDKMSRMRMVLRDELQDHAHTLSLNMHHFQALKEEPDLSQLSKSIQDQIVHDPNMASLFRSAKELKLELSQLATDMMSDEVHNKDFVAMVRANVELIVASFPNKDIFEQRGRQSQFQNIRNLIVKLKNVPKQEVGALVTSLLPELTEVTSFENTSATLRSLLSRCVEELSAELQRVRDENDAIESELMRQSYNNTNSGSMRGRGLGLSSPKSGASASLRKKSSVRSALGGSKMGLGTYKSLRSTRMRSPDMSAHRVLLDSALIKRWCRSLTLAFFSSDLSQAHVDLIQNTLVSLNQKSECNDVVDAAVSRTCDA
eukprot:gene30267-39000_t